MIRGKYRDPLHGGSGTCSRRRKIGDPGSVSGMATAPAAEERGPSWTTHAPWPLRDDTSRIPAPPTGITAPGSFRRRLLRAVVGQLADDSPLAVPILFPFQAVVDRGERDMRLTESRRLTHERFERLASLVESARGKVQCGDLVAH